MQNGHGIDDALSAQPSILPLIIYIKHSPRLMKELNGHPKGRCASRDGHCCQSLDEKSGRHTPHTRERKNPQKGEIVRSQARLFAPALSSRNQIGAQRTSQRQ